MIRDKGMLEGSGGTRFVQLMRRYGYSEGLTFSVASVTKAAPALAIRFEGDPFDLSGDEIIVADHLLKHKRRMSINGAPAVDVVVESPLVVGDIVSVAITQDGQLYYVMDKV